MGVEPQGAPGEVAAAATGARAVRVRAQRRRPHPGGRAHLDARHVLRGASSAAPSAWAPSPSAGWACTFGLGLWATISAIAVGTIVGQILLVPLILIGSRTATNNATSSGATFGVRGRLHRQRHRAADLPVLGGAHRVDQRIRGRRRSRAGCSGCPTTPAPRAWPTRWSRPSRWRWRSGGSAGWCAATTIICVARRPADDPHARRVRGLHQLGLRRQPAAAGGLLAHVVPGGDDDRGLGRAARVHDPR